MGTIAIAWHQFGEIKNKEELDTYLFGKEYGHGDYCHYTRLNILNSILLNKEFWLGNVSGFNDQLDSEQFGDEKALFYSLCFSTGVNENLALWYLYSGMDGHGARLRFTKSTVQYLLANSTFTLNEIEKNKEGIIVKDTPILPLVEGVSMKTQFKDILYYKYSSKKTTVDLKYNTMTNHQLLLSDFNQYLSENKGFCKGLIWYYEKETRFLIKLIGPAADIVKHDTGKDYVVKMRFDEKLYKRINIDFAPEIEDINGIVDRYDGIRDYIIATSHAKLSDYHGTLKMDLCKKCNRK